MAAIPIDTVVFSFEGLLPLLDSPPIAARRALDHAGLRLPVEGWRSLPTEERQRLCQLGAAERVEPDLVLAALRRASPSLIIDELTLAPVLEGTLERAAAHARARAALLAERARRPSPARQLLAELLFDKEVYALDRVCSLLELANPEEDFARIFRGVRSPSPRLRSSSRELLETVLRAPYKERVLALVDDISGDAPAESALDSPGAVVRALASDRDPLVSSIAAYVAADEGLDLAALVVEQVKRSARETVLGEDFLEGPLTRRSGAEA